jgi:farnesyl-diphosphate farnesyltransferase
MATELVIQHYNLKSALGQLLLSTSEICGRALQKTNIIKDFARDLERGFSYLPASWQHEINFTPLFLQDAPLHWKHRALSDVLDELDNSATYVTNLPQSASGYRQASLLAMFPAYQTLLLAAQRHENLFTPQHQVKISRLTMARCLADARRFVHNNQAILKYGREIRSQVQEIFDRFAGPELRPSR